MIAEGQAIVRGCLRRNQPGPYQLQAAINAVHADAGSVQETDWSQIVVLYDQLLTVAPTPVVALNRAVAVGEVDGPGAALVLVDGLDLDGYHPFHATRGWPAAPLAPERRGRQRLRKGGIACTDRSRAQLPGWPGPSLIKPVTGRGSPRACLRNRP
jgi:predicted RNA polymerase sigma factor